MNDLYHIWELVNQYPTCIPFYMFALTLALMFISFITGFGFDTSHHFDTGSDGHFHGDSVHHFDLHILDDLFISSGVSKAPLIIGLCLTFLPMSILSFLMQDTIFPIIERELPIIAYYAVTITILFILFVVSLYIAGFLCKPIASFIQNNTSYVIDYIGQEAKVINNIKINSFGYAKCVINHSEHTLKVDSDIDLQVGDKVTILKYNKEKDRYLVEKI